MDRGCAARVEKVGGDGGGWFVTVDGNAHVERHVRRRRSNGGGMKGGFREPRGRVRGAGGARVWSGSSPGDAVLIARAG